MELSKLHALPSDLELVRRFAGQETVVNYFDAAIKLLLDSN